MKITIPAEDLDNSLDPIKLLSDSTLFSPCKTPITETIWKELLGDDVKYLIAHNLIKEGKASGDFTLGETAIGYISLNCLKIKAPNDTCRTVNLNNVTLKTSWLTGKKKIIIKNDG